VTKQSATVSMQDDSTYTLSSLLSDKNAKLEKTNDGSDEYLVTGLSLAPAHTSGYEVCQGASDGCRKACLFTAGQGRFENVQRARIAKTRLFFQNRDAFKAMLYADIERWQAKATRKGVKLAIRLNVLSDLPWERIFPDMFVRFADVQFYDYTKVAGRKVPANYHLTFSRSESNETTARKELASGRNVTVVFRDKTLPTMWFGKPVVSGDTHDLRFLDSKGAVVGLYAKGRARTDQSGFVIDAEAV
jgi:hypothetical protein